jgi:hypothetical protein
LSSLPLEACGLALEACGLPAPGHLLLGQALSEPRIHSQNNLNLVPIDYFFSTLTPGPTSAVRINATYLVFLYR